MIEGFRAVLVRASAVINVFVSDRDMNSRLKARRAAIKFTPYTNQGPAWEQKTKLLQDDVQPGAQCDWRGVFQKTCRPAPNPFAVVCRLVSMPVGAVAAHDI